MPTAHIINIQKYSIHDGDGIRTVIFFKGCPLSCIWCHNPESRRFEPELLYNRDKCTLCLACIPVCPGKRIFLAENSGSLQVSADSCRACGACAEACLNEAREIVGKEYSVQELMAELDKDAMFYEQSGGGVTLSGGEVMAGDMDFLAELLQSCRKRGYRVNIDTCGYAPYENFRRILEYVDVFLYDIKLIDPEKHKQYTGCDNALILDNLMKLSEAGANIHIRMPLIEGINSEDTDIDSVLEFLKLLRIGRVYLLPHHNFGRHKAARLGIELNKDLAPPSADRLSQIERKFIQHGYAVKIGG